MFYVLLIKHHGKWAIDSSSWNKKELQPDYRVAKRVRDKAKIISFDDDTQSLIDLCLKHHNECL